MMSNLLLRQVMQHNVTHLGDLAVTTQVRQLRGFVSAPAGTDLSQLLEALEENNIHVLDPVRFAPGAVKITDKIRLFRNHYA